MDPRSPNKLIATKHCFLILGDSLRTADVFPVVAFSPSERKRSNDRKYVCGSQANSEMIPLSFSLFLYFSFFLLLLLLLFYVIINFYKNYFIILFYLFLFFMKMFFLFFHVPGFSGMFRNVPECSMFRVLSTPCCLSLLNCCIIELEK